LASRIQNAARPGEVILVAERLTAQPSLDDLLTQPPMEGPELDLARIALAGANQGAPMSGADLLPGRSSYFLGNDPGRWQRDVPSFAKVRWSEAYPGIDVLFYGRERQLEFDFLVKPGADPSLIGLAPTGADRTSLSPSGDLMLRVGHTDFRFQKPVCYQEVRGQRVKVEGRFRLKEGRVGIELGTYDRRKPLVIDPVLVYSTYLGGAGNDLAARVFVTPSGEAFVTGQTLSLNFPLFNPGQAVNRGSWDAFVSHFNAAGNALLYSTYYGGNGDDFGMGIAVDATGAIYLAGSTTSTNLWTMAPIQGANAGGSDVFLAKINSAGTLDYATYLGGTGNDYAYGLAIDSSGDAYVVGSTASPNWPTVLPLQAALLGTSDAFVAKLNPAGSALVFSTYLGGSGDESAFALTLDATRAVTITGTTSSSNYPTASPFQGTYGGANDAFVTKISPAGNALLYSSYLGGSGLEVGFGIALDSGGNAYVAGATTSTNFPLATPAQPLNGGGLDAFVSKVSQPGTALLYSTYLGGSGNDYATGIALDGLDSAYVAGVTASPNFPVLSPLQAALSGPSDAFLTR
ncbi:MAG: hypothetical protein B7X11_02335, partial [Acidobacteria bacterium 37-65-4]